MTTRSILLLSFFTVITTVQGASPPYSTDNIAGVWRHFDLSYEFSPAGTMREAVTDSLTEYSALYRYELVQRGTQTLIRYAQDLADTASCRYLLVCDITDSTGTFARGTPFIRNGGETGLAGSWTYADGLSIITWRFDRETAEYLHQSFDILSGDFATVEYHTGILTKGQGEETDRFSVSFDDGTGAVLFPLIAGDIMYLFDLTAGRADFMKVATITASAD